MAISLVYPGLPGQGEDCTCRFGGNPLPLVMRVQVPAHLHQAGGAIVIAERQQQQGPRWLAWPRARRARDNRPQAERRGKAALVFVPAAQALLRYGRGRQRTTGMGAERRTTSSRSTGRRTRGQASPSGEAADDLS